MNYTIRRFGAADIDAAKEIFDITYERERKQNLALPKAYDTHFPMQEFAYFAGNGMGVAAYNEEKMVGYLCAYEPYMHVYNSPTDSGCWSPLHASGALIEDEKLWLMMYRSACRQWAGAGAKYFTMTVFHGDKSAQAALTRCGLGFRCADAVRGLEPVGAKCPDGYETRVVEAGDFSALGEFRTALAHHLMDAPVFMLIPEADQVESIQEKEQDPELTTIGLFYQERLIGFIDVRSGGENFISSSPAFLNIHGAYLMPEYRGQGLFESLVDAAARYAKEQKAQLLGVDYETMNINASLFWEKYFARYTVSMVRRLD